jgi:tetratricopeptide (TPR) repeat protein
MAFVCGIGALVLASVLAPTLKAANPQEPDILLQFLGGTADLAAEKAYHTADVYFHAGITEECPVHHGSHDVRSHQHADSPPPLLRVIERLHGQTAPKKIRHIQGVEEKELLPWFAAAVRLDPRHIEAWRTGSYWFFRTGDSQRAEVFISDGIRRNPKEYRLYLDRGILYHRLKKWKKAVSDFETAGWLWKNDAEDSRFDRRGIRIYLEDARKQLETPASISRTTNH